jgi:hypothetical protein
MSDPVRLLSAGADDFEAELLRSAEADVGPNRLMKRTLGAVAVAGTLTSASAAGQAAVAAKVGGLSLLKWIGIGALAGAGVVTTYVVTSSRAPVAPARAVVAAAVAPPVAEVAKAAAPPPSSPSGAVDAPPPAAGDPEPAARLATSASPRAVAPASPAPAPAAVAAEATAAPDAKASLRDEVASLDRARGALAHGDGAQALRELDRHAAEFPHGALGPEATVLRIDALVRTGQRPAAEALAERFLASPALAAHATRVRSILHPHPAASNL